jgi:very-short-patch-repair endonuclease
VLASGPWERAFVEAQVKRLVHPRDMLALLERHPRHASAPLVSSALATDPALTRSEAEGRLLTMLSAARLPKAAVNSRVGGYEVDFLWPAERLIVEVDGYAFHSTRTAFERDRLRDADLQARGYRVIRVTWRQLVDEPEAVLARLAQALRMASSE